MSGPARGYVRHGEPAVLTPGQDLGLDRCASPLGPLLLVHDRRGALCALEFEDGTPRLLRLLRRYHGACLPAACPADPAIVQAIAAYFDGALHALAAIPVRPGGTVFQNAAWAALRSIPAGATLSYGTLAARLGRPGAARAVGHANGANPVGIVIPCHRLVGAAGELTGYGGGLDRKRWLLAHERQHAADRVSSDATPVRRRA